MNTELEKVMKGLECCSQMAGEICRNCPYANECEEVEGLLAGAVHLAADALELLKAREARVMTLEQLLDKQEFSEDTRPVWFEYVHGNVKAVVLLYTEYREDEDTVTTIGTGAYVQESWIQGEYGKTWRCWTSKPTDEQREKVKWGRKSVTNSRT